jgi:hypothetical protein
LSSIFFFFFVTLSLLMVPNFNCFCTFQSTILFTMFRLLPMLFNIVSKALARGSFLSRLMILSNNWYFVF